MRGRWLWSRCRTAHSADAAARAARRRTRRWWRRRARCCACTRSASACACSATARGARPRSRRCAACARATTRRAQTPQGPGGTGACSPRQGHGFGVAVQPSSPVHASGVDHEPETLDQLGGPEVALFHRQVPAQGPLHLDHRECVEQRTCQVMLCQEQVIQVNKTLLLAQRSLAGALFHTLTVVKVYGALGWHLSVEKCHLWPTQLVEVSGSWSAPNACEREVERRPASDRLLTAPHALCRHCCIGMGARPPAHKQESYCGQSWRMH